MSMTQVLQHGNADQGRFTNTRVFHVNWLIHWAVFPLGNDYHLPHHLFPMVPHYNLQKLHALLMQTEEYQKAMRKRTCWHKAKRWPKATCGESCG